MRDLRAVRWIYVLLLGASVACAQAAPQGASGTVTSQGANAGLALQIAGLLNDPSVARAHWGIDVTELDGTPIYALNEGQFFQPASNAKLFTTAAAMAMLGPTKTFETKVVAKGPISQGVLKGDLELIGGGDANLSGRVFPYALVEPPAARTRKAGAAAASAPALPAELKPLRHLEEMADKVAASGLKVVEGDVVGDDTYFAWEPYGTDWSIDDLVWGYGAPVSALSVNDNKVKVTVAGAKKGDPAAVSMEPDVEYYTLDNRVVSGGDGKTPGFDRAPGSKVLNLFGGIAPNGTDVEDVAILDPAEYAATALKQMLEERGITVKGKVRVRHWVQRDSSTAARPAPKTTAGANDSATTGGRVKVNCSIDAGEGDVAEETVLATHTSPPLGQDVVWTNKVSQNLHAEMMLRNMGKATGCMGSLRSGTTAVRNFLVKAGIDKDDFVLYDGSGLSGHDLVTPRAMVRLLQYAAMDPKTGAAQPWFAAWKRSLPVGGVDGSLENRFTKELKGKVFAKTGTLGETRALSGYVEGVSGKTVAFAIFVGNHAPGSTVDRDVMDKIVAAIAAAN
jgi:D-alanyl-D-alanine carboxypeptidase/D-alanyl-D-alanine-endopeptidase (penicillin-binding protein 4)